MKKLLLIALLNIGLLSFNTVNAHESAAKHGGMVQTANDLSFELVLKGNKAFIYIDDHDQPVSPVGMTGKMTILNGKEKSEARLIPDKDKLLAENVKLSKGAKIIASIVTHDQKTSTVRYSVK